MHSGERKIMPKGIPLSSDKLQKIEKMIRDGYQWAVIQERFGIAFNTYCKIKRGMRKENVKRAPESLGIN